MDRKEIWTGLFSDAEQIVRLEPWETLSDAQLLSIRTKDMTEPLYVNVLGNAGMTYGLVFYKGSAGLNDFHMLRVAEQLNLEHFLMLQQNCYVMYLGKEDDIPEEQKKIIAETGVYRIDPKADDMPYFMRLAAGYFPWTPNDRDAEELLGFMDLLLSFWNEAEFEETWDIEEDGRICCGLLDEEGSWNITYEEAPFLEYYADFSVPHVSEIREAAAESERVGGDYEADIYCMYSYVTDEAYEYPLASNIALFADCESGEILHMEMLEPEEDASMSFAEALLNTVQSCGIPDTLYVRSPYLRDMLKNVCTELEIKTEVVDELEILDDAEVKLEQFSSLMLNMQGELPF